jgi:hypothetical protein
MYVKMELAKLSISTFKESNKDLFSHPITEKSRGKRIKFEYPPI